MATTSSNGRICYVELPATDVALSADFYNRVFGWTSRTRRDGSTAFDDTSGGISGSWIAGRKAGGEPGLLLYIMVDSVAETMKMVVANGGQITQTIGADAPEITARFSDLAGNILGLYQEPC